MALVNKGPSTVVDFCKQGFFPKVHGRERVHPTEYWNGYLCDISALDDLYDVIFDISWLTVQPLV